MVYPEPILFLFTLFSALFGVVVGSFLNVCIHRLPRGYVSIVFPASHCTQCGTLLKWYDNIPIFSWLSLGGACRYCKTSISFRYLVVEALTGCLFVLYTRAIVLSPIAPFASFPVEQQMFALAVSLYLVCVMIIITFIDIAYRIIPDSLTYGGILASPFISAVCPVLHPALPGLHDPHLSGFVSAILGMLVGAGSLYCIGIVGKVIFRKEAMGFGDVKLMALVGGFLGWDAVLLIFLIACLLGTVFGLVSLLVTKDHYIPFGPYLAIGTLVVLLAKAKILYLCTESWPQFVARGLGMIGNY